MASDSTMTVFFPSVMGANNLNDTLFMGLVSCGEIHLD